MPSRHHVQVDQSGKIGNTRVATVLAFADGINHSILIPAQAKRECLRHLRVRGPLGTVSYLRIFAAALFLLVRAHLDQMDTITIDTEYTGHDADIRGMLLRHIRTVTPDFQADRIRFARIGKKAEAHVEAIAVYRGEKSAGERLVAEDLLALLPEK